MGHNYQGSLASEEVDQELEKCVNRERLILLALFNYLEIRPALPHKHPGSDQQT
jgi:hypothetical protein